MQGKNQVSGTHGAFWWNGSKVIEVSSFEAKVTANREDVQVGMSMDSKVVSMAGEGTFAIKKVYTRHKAGILDSWKQGKDLRFTFVAGTMDPDTVGNQQERISITDCWMNELILHQFEKGTVTNEEFSFGFRPDNASFLDVIS